MLSGIVRETKEKGNALVEIRQAMASDLTDSIGASSLLSERFGSSFSVDSVQQLVKQNKLRAFMFREGKLVERTSAENTRGKDLIFLRADLYAVERPRKVGRPAQGTRQGS